MTKSLQGFEKGWQQEISSALEALHAGNMILFPTDTIWGLGCDATSEDAVASVSALKKRAPEKGYVLLAADIDMIKEYVEEVPPRIQTLLDFHVRPLTVIYKGAKNLPANCYAPDGTVAFRVPKDDMCQELIRAYGKPLVATSANVSNEPFPKHFGEISSEILLNVQYIFKYRRTDKKINAPSTIARLNKKNEVEVIRPGQ